MTENHEKTSIDTRWFRRHADTLTILVTIISSLLWMNGKFNEIEKDIAIIKTALVMKNIMPADIACTAKDIEKNDESKKKKINLHQN